ncbi:MAG: hypothetical protein JW966_12035 [Anaerolineae bacterium]|nr:hypothetical protein [Anaerolineae bacterium]
MAIEDVMTIAALTIAFAAFIGPYIVTSRQENRRRAEEQRIWHRDFIHAKMGTLVDLRAELQYLQTAPFKLLGPKRFGRKEKAEDMFQKCEVAYGKAFGIVQAFPDPEIRKHAEKIMLAPPGDEKLQAINAALMAFGDLLDESMGKYGIKDL